MIEVYKKQDFSSKTFANFGNSVFILIRSRKKFPNQFFLTRSLFSSKFNQHCATLDEKYGRIKRNYGNIVKKAIIKKMDPYKKVTLSILKSKLDLGGGGGRRRVDVNIRA